MGKGKEDAQHLFDSVLPFAEKMLAEYGEFYPYGAAMTLTGDVVDVSVFEGNEYPPSSEIIDLLNSAFLKAAANREYRTTAVVYDVRITLPSGQLSDAIAVNLDHISGYSIVVYLPYKKLNQAIEYGELSVQEGRGAIFN
ncbi:MULTISPECIES: hypothetical protein [Vibrio]|uniref:hypothetical protein n=1 Tax=Vibrio TaxID=662 RepID=UPI000971A890|nr:MULTISPECIES: hypothetical protein [Vibrio]APX05940.1 hypothetical protein BWP24_07105 [Vibrio campbellii]ARR06121.1 hypothetical protein Vc3S01_1359 [Vibrio campbellii]AUW04757.1 hypothetical protein C1N51_14175 [Vibrio campbellii]NDJ84198.1 hypothetical protein [Vibrio sp. LB10LO1]HDM8062589.1 hypothetical protein [Vibrio harveyi]